MLLCVWHGLVHIMAFANIEVYVAMHVLVVFVGFESCVRHAL